VENPDVSLIPASFPNDAFFKEMFSDPPRAKAQGCKFTAKAPRSPREDGSFGVSEFRLYSTADGSGVDRKAPRAARIRKNFVPMDGSRKAIPGLSKRSSSSPPLLKNLGDLGDLAVPPIFN
jgi:hypothetical protein